MSDRLDRIEKILENVSIDLKELQKLVGISEKNKGDIFEDNFYNSLLKSKCLDGIVYENTMKKIELRIGKNIIKEIDIVLLNSNYIALIELKTKANINDFTKLDKLKESYLLKYPYEKRDIKIYYASSCFTKEIKEIAKEKGYKLLSLIGEIIEVEN